MNVGDSLPTLERAVTLTDMVAYGGATWDWHQLHYDPAYLATRDLPAPVVDGQMFGALFVKALQDWLGPRCFVTELTMQYRNLMYAGETVRIEGTVTAASPASVSVELRATVAASVFGDTRAAVSPASAVVALDRIGA